MFSRFSTVLAVTDSPSVTEFKQLLERAYHPKPAIDDLRVCANISGALEMQVRVVPHSHTIIIL